MGIPEWHVRSGDGEMEERYGDTSLPDINIPDQPPHNRHLLPSTSPTLIITGENKFKKYFKNCTNLLCTKIFIDC